MRSELWRDNTYLNDVIALGSLKIGLHKLGLMLGYKLFIAIRLLRLQSSTTPELLFLSKRLLAHKEPEGE